MVFQALRPLVDIYSEFASFKGVYLVALDDLIRGACSAEDLYPVAACSQEGHEHWVTVAKDWTLCVG